MNISIKTRNRKERRLRKTRGLTIKKRCVKNGISVGKTERKFHPPSASPADGGCHFYEVCWIAERRHAPGPTGRVKVQNSSNLTGTASLPERTFPASSVV